MKRLLAVALAGCSLVAVWLAAPAQADTRLVKFTCDGSTVQATANPGDRIVIEVDQRCQPLIGPTTIPGLFLSATEPGYSVSVRADATLGVYKDAMWLIPDRDHPLVTQAKQRLDLTVGSAPPQLNYVALGDSYSSGEGAGPGNYFQTNGIDIKCHRAPTAWSFKLAQTSPQINDDVQNAACSGAVTSNMLNTWFKGEQPQVEYLRQRNAIKPVDLVTFTVGGNDAGFSGLVGDCYYTDCAVDAQTGKWRSKAREAARRTAQQIVPALRAAAPKATLVLVGYPRLLPIQARDTVNCPWLTDTERTALNALVRDLNKIFDDAILTERFENASYVPPLHIVPANALDGHELCSRRPHVVRVNGNPRELEQAHPDANGQGDYAATVLAGLKSFGIVSG